MTQIEFKKYWGKYCSVLEKQGLKVFCSDFYALSTWVRKEFDTDSHRWEFTDETVYDLHDTPIKVGVVEGHRFVLVNLERDKIFDHLGFKVRGLNAGMYGRAEPETRNGQSYYNRSGELIFWYNEEQKEQLEEKIADAIEWEAACNKFNEVKPQINRETFVEVPASIAMNFLESVPPKRMQGSRFLAGEAYDIDPKTGDYTYYHFERVNKDTYKVKFSTINEFEK